jgi:hypothetical protein
MTKQNIVHPDDRQAGFDTGTYSGGIVVNGFILVNGQICAYFKIPA